MPATSTEQLQQTVVNANEKQTPLHIQGSGSKSFLNGNISGESINTRALNEIINYEPTELYITAQAGTSLQTIERALAKNQQMLAFEPPHFGPAATLGGTVACGLSGPRRPYSGAVRDAVLGVHLINGFGKHLRFGGQVMKNVAGYDISRLMVGAMGTLGIITQATLKVAPQPQAEASTAFQLTAQEAIARCSQWSKQEWPISATFYHDGILTIRLSGTDASIITAKKKLGGEPVNDSDQFWEQVREQKSTFFQTDKPLWRISIPRSCEPLELPGESAFEWNGGLRWLASELDATRLHQEIKALHGHARLFERKHSLYDCAEKIVSIPEPLLNLQRQIKNAFDPAHILNRNAMVNWTA